MSSRLARLGSWSLTFLTVVVLALSGWLLIQPESLLRTRWDRYRTSTRLRERVKQDWERVVAASTPLYNGDSAPDVIEVADYGCGFCRQAVASVDSALGAGVRVAYLHAVRPSTPMGQEAAIAALCAAEAGYFLPMHHHLMATDAWQRDPNWVDEAEEAGVSDLEGFARCLTSESVLAHLEMQTTAVERLGIAATPTFLSHNDVMSGIASAGALQDLGAER